MTEIKKKKISDPSNQLNICSGRYSIGKNKERNHDSNENKF
jgi:hypothetical protein